MNEIKQSVRDFFKKHISTKEIYDDSDIFQLGYVNSLFAMQIVNFVEKKFSLTVENEDLTINNFKTIDCITGFVEKKLGVDSVQLKETYELSN